jgi:hypothetical protein
MGPQFRIGVELTAIVAGYAFFFAVVEFPSVRMAVPQAAATVVWAVLGATVLLFITEVIYYIRYRVDWLSDPM